jgi:hypothetical protein
LQEGVAAVNRLSGSRIGIAVIRPVLAAIRLRNRMQSLEAAAVAGRWVVRGAVNPSGELPTDKQAESEAGGEGGGAGTAADPFLIDWPKRPLANYTSVWLVPANVANGSEFAQAQLRGMTGAEEFRAGAPRALFGGRTIGVTSAYATVVGKTYGPAPNPRPSSLPQLQQFKDLFKEHGYNRARGDAEGTTDADHVSELQMAGPPGDTFSNLWPLNLSENRSSGSTLSQTRVTPPNGSPTAIRDLNPRSWYFKIRRFLR